jgi:glycosyltransferase involved in cell wall biosynthesis
MSSGPSIQADETDRTEQTPAPPKLTIGMPTYDDYDGVYFSLQALRLYHPEICESAEFIVIDNHPDGASAAALQELGGHVPRYRYIAEAGQTGSAAAKQRIFDEASGEIVLCMDCHVFIVPGAVQRLIDYFAANPGSVDLIQGPLLLDDLKTVQTHFDPKWSGGMFGTWGLDPRGIDPDAEAFDIPMQGMGVFACRKAAWPGFNPQFRGFGGEEFYIHEKFRQHGARTLCLPFLRWMHRFARPMGVPYRNIWEDRIWNYIVGFRELGLSTAELEAHFCNHVGKEFTEGFVAGMQHEKG